MRFTLLELSGGMGDLGTFLPLVVAMVLACRLDLGMILVCAGLMNLATGLMFRQPIPVQPMKAIAAVAITEALTQGELVAAGLIMGVLMMVLAASGLMDAINKVVPRAVVMGIQLVLTPTPWPCSRRCWCWQVWSWPGRPGTPRPRETGRCRCSPRPACWEATPASGPSPGAPPPPPRRCGAGAARTPGNIRPGRIPGDAWLPCGNICWIQQLLCITAR